MCHRRREEAAGRGGLGLADVNVDSGVLYCSSEFFFSFFFSSPVLIFLVHLWNQLAHLCNAFVKLVC